MSKKSQSTPMHWQPSMMGEKEMMNYMAKDYESFRQSLLELLTKKFPEWNYKSDADTRIMLVELFSYIADELSYYQDRVANEAFLRTARKRFSVGSHLNLVDYRLHNGCSAIAFIK
ncbi:MAG: putative baseplate assembly protein, partial [Thaumarchaeota archaeon]|nr:putative baseplate assembly protein [Nitrososphaerota archaeon]